MDKEDIFRMREDGSIYSKTLSEWREMLTVLARIDTQNRGLIPKIEESGKMIRHLIASEEARQGQKKTLRWAKIAALLAGFGVALGVASFLYSVCASRHGPLPSGAASQSSPAARP